MKNIKKLDPYRIEKLKVVKRSLVRRWNKIIQFFKQPRSIQEEIEFYDRVISYPLKEISRNNYCGGLVDSDTGKLIESAIIQIQSIGDITIADDEIPERKGNFLYGGIIFNHFGHFLIDSLGRLWAYELVKDLDPYVFFYECWGAINFSDENHYINQVLTGFNIPREKVLFLREPAKLEKVIVPRDRGDYWKNPDPIFWDFLKSFNYRDELPEGFENAEKIYVSRGKLPFRSFNNHIHGRFIAENFFEAYLESEGYKIFWEHPKLAKTR